MYRLDDPDFRIPWKGDDIAGPALTRMFERLPDGARCVVEEAETHLVFDQPLELSDRVQLQLVTPYCPRVPEVVAPLIEYVGPATERFLILDRMRWFQYMGWRTRPGNADVAIDLDGYSRGHPGTECTIGNGFIANERANPKFVGVRISETAGENQEYHTVYDMRMYGYGAGRAVRIGDSINAKHTRIVLGSYAGFGTAIDMQAGGLKLNDVNFTGNDLNVFAGDCQMATRDVGSMSEHSKQHLQFNASGTYAAQGGRHGIENTPVGKSYWEFGVNAQLSISGVSYDQPPPDGATLYSPVTYRGLRLRGNYYSGAGMTLAQLGLVPGRGAWSTRGENIRDLPARAGNSIESSHGGDHIAASMDSIAVGWGPEWARFGGWRLLELDLPSGPEIPARRNLWRSFEAPGLTPDDYVVGVYPAGTFSVGLTGWKTERKNVLALHFSNGSTNALAPVSGPVILSVVRLQRVG